MRRLVAWGLAGLLCAAHVGVFAQEIPAPETMQIDGFEVALPTPELECVWPVDGDGAAPCDADPARAQDQEPGEPQGRGIASWYGPRFHGRRTASGERYDMHALTAAHPTLPFGTVVRVENTADGRSVDVRINDRGPHIKQRIIDLSRAAASALGMLDAGGGLKEVILRVIKAPAR